MLGLSQPVVFTLVALGGALAPDAKVRSSPRWLAKITIIGLAMRGSCHCSPTGTVLGSSLSAADRAICAKGAPAGI
jgi:hypothetical protein